MIHITGVINDPLGQPNNTGSSDHYFSLETCFILRDFEKWGDGRSDMC